MPSRMPLNFLRPKVPGGLVKALCKAGIPIAPALLTLKSTAE